MDTQKIGKFLKELRNEKKLTQEQLAELMYVSGRTVSRWETGTNLPDIAILLDLADFYEVDIREVLDGQRKESNMDKEKEETIIKVAEYSQEENRRLMGGGKVLFIIGLIVSFANLIIEGFNLEGEGFIYNLADFIRGLNDGIVFAMMLIGFLYTTKRLNKIKEIKQRLLKKL